MSKAKIKVYAFTSLDGYVSKLDGDMEWIRKFLESERCVDDLKSFSNSVEHILISGAHYSNLREQEVYAFGEKPLLILVSHKPPSLNGDNVEYVFRRPDRRFDYPQIATELKEKANGDIWLVGGDEMIGSLIENGLVDELTVNVLPLTLGNGRPLFSRNRLEQDWKLKEIEGYDNGALRMSYALK